MTNLEKILSGNFDNCKNYGDNLNNFKMLIKTETKDIDQKSKEKIHKMEFDQLLDELNTKDNIVFRTMMMPNLLRRYPYGCMEVMEKMETINEKYMACLFFHYLDMAQKQSAECKIMARAFFERIEPCNA
jgi:hypothetical protein